MNLLKKRVLTMLMATCLAPCAWTADQTQHPAGVHAKTIAADSPQPVLMAGLRSELVWKRTSPNSKELDGPVLYQLLFRSSATPGHLPKIAPNFTLTNSLISEGNGFIAIGALSINTRGDVVSLGGVFTGDGSGLTNINSSKLGGQPAGNYARLDIGNSFTGNQNVNGVLSATRVGIGTAAPAFKLQAADSDATPGGIQINISNTSTADNSFSVFSASADNGTVVSQMYADGLGTGPLGTPGGVFGTFTQHPIGFFTGNIQRMGIDTDGSVSINNKITSYNGAATAGNGVPGIVAAFNLTGLKTSQNLALFTPTAPGLFRVSIYELCTTADTTGVIAGFLNWKDLSGTDQSIVLTPSGFVPVLSCNAAGHYSSVTFVVQSAANIPIVLQVGIVNNFTGSGDYALFATVEQLF